MRRSVAAIAVFSFPLLRPAAQLQVSIQSFNAEGEGLYDAQINRPKSA
jgi:hypothetical protein